MAKSVCVIAEFRQGGFRRVSYEVASAGRRLADALDANVCAIAVGSGVSGSAADLGRYAVDKVYVADDPALEKYVAETYVPVVADIVAKCDPAAIIIPSSVDGKDLASRLAARLQAGLAQDCTEIACEGGSIKGEEAGVCRQVLRMV